MTSGEFSGVDHDLLADYVGGVLDGTPEQTSVARLIEDDPAWGTAYAGLARAVDLVHADLADWAAAPAPQIPPAVTDRISAALADAGPAPVDADGTLDQADRKSGEPRPTGRPMTAVPAQRAGGPARQAEGSGRNTGPGRRARRWARIAGPVALAAASVTAVGFAFSNLTDAGRGDTAVTANGGTVADSASGGAVPQGAAPFRTTGPARHSGTDYGPEQLSGTRRPLAAAEGWKASEVAPPRFSAADGLDRLARPEALQSCLRAIGAEHAAGPLTVELIDYASFEGRPALVVTFLDAHGERWAWASGPECGVPGSGADTRFRTRVG
ncbi:hypothetical protein AB0C02_03570 [Micromonospora sp. NPDC048999]|uniref:hypothetical protein n=1 Tax=Micromonospora sp. NPDC048999 TaxID=3155391 RepID=UPI0033E9EB01